MKISEFARIINAEIITGLAGMEREVNGVYACDLLSWVMSNVSKGDAWITVLTHMNTVAVAVFSDASCIVIPEGIAVEEATSRKAAEEGMPILRTNLSTYKICSVAHDAGI